MTDTIKNALTSIHPALWLAVFYLVTSVGISWAIYLLRKFLPGVWAVLERDDKSLKLALELVPAQVLGHAAVVLSGVEANGVGLGLGATFVHLLMKWAPMLSYQGQTGRNAKTTLASLAMPLLLALSLGSAMILPGCGGALAAIAPIAVDVLHAITDGQQILDDIDRTADRFFEVRPDPALEQHYNDAMSKARRALSVANRATSGVQSLSQKDVDSAFYDFKDAYAELVVLLKEAGMVREPGTVAAPGVPQVELEQPMAFRLKVE